TAPNSSRKRPRKRLQHSIRACAEASKFHVKAILQEIQDAFVLISFRPDRYEKVVGRAFGRVHSKRSVGRSHIKNVHGDIDFLGAEFLMEQRTNTVEDKDVCAPIHVLIEVVGAIETCGGLRNRSSG